MTLREVIRDRIRQEGPIPFAAFADLALYHRELGYYAAVAQRSGRGGDFYTSVDVGPHLGRLLARQCAEMWRLLDPQTSALPPSFDLVEAAAGNARLARDLLDAAAAEDPAFYAAIRLHLVERSAAARAAHRTTLGPHAARLASSGAHLPRGIRGVVLANELLDALPPHAVVMTDDGLREVYVDVAPAGSRFVERLGPVTARAQAHIERHRITLEPGWRAEVTPDAAEWVERAVASIDRGFLLLIDYGHEARELYSATHAAGTLTTYRSHRAAVAGDGATPSWLADPGAYDITAHVDLTAVRDAAELGGATTLGVLDQLYFLLGLGALDDATGSGDREARLPAAGQGEPLGMQQQAIPEADADSVAALRMRLALKTLLIPGGLGSTHKVLIFGKGVGTPALAGCAYRVRAT